ncbi:putative ADP-ribosylation factor GTPase-activating protein AGD14 [Vitis vinifera]|uniref:Putative ADP-ribosylation factor GTPase-activating protein AGD14 n=1 Tax=Vitis vinifera TaxID=29760 RepID=A0A438JQ54_VITVI|nr:putative ADP-ribosylation factor GTPase-activating protein AGD14 [Vitis vinifera]
MGPQYVCTNFWTFVCTTCSGIHREFTHRVKSVSMAKFTSQEVSSLQRGGNERVKEFYFKEWDPQRHSFPDSSNIERLRDFIKHVYVDRRYSGERSFDKPPRVKMGDKEEPYENRKMDNYQGGSRSPPYEDSYDRRYSDQRSPGGRSDDKNFRYGYDGRRSPGSDLEIGSTVIIGEVLSPDHQKDLDASSPPMVRPVREILGDNVSPLRVIEPPKANGGRVGDGFARTQDKFAFHSSLILPSIMLWGTKRENSGILIDFDADPEPPVAATVPQTQQPPVQTIAQPISSSNDNWASFDFATEAKVSQAPSNVNALETVLSQLSVPASVPGHGSGVPNSGGAPTAVPVGNVSVLPMSGDSLFPPVRPIPTSPFLGGAPAPVNTFAAFPPAAAAAAAPGLTPMLHGHDGNSFVKVTGAGQWPSMQYQQHSLFPDTGSQSIAQQFAPSVGGTSTNQQWNSPLLPNTQGPFSAPAAQAPQTVSKPQVVASSLSSPPLPVEVKPAGRKELPLDLFAATYQPISMQVPGWQTGPPHGMGFHLQYNTAAPLPSTFSHSSKSTNPFDLNNEPPPAQAPTFPSMASLQGSLPNMPPSMGLLHSSSAGTQSTWTPPQSSLYPLAMPPQAPPYVSGMPPQVPPYASGMPPRAYMGQQVPGAIPPSSHQGVGSFGSEDAAFSSLNPNHLIGGRSSAPAALDKLSSVGGNPFG